MSLTTAPTDLMPSLVSTRLPYEVGATEWEVTTTLTTRARLSFAVRTEMNDFLTDCLTTALEGGIGYWSECSAYDWQNEDPAKRHAHIEVTDDYTDDEEREQFDVHLVDLLAALKDPKAPRVLVFALHKIMAGQRWSHLDESSGFDADDADRLFQIACFGTVVYG